MPRNPNYFTPTLAALPMFSSPPTALEVAAHSAQREHESKEDVLTARLTETEQADILRIIEQVARAFPHGFSWETIVDYCSPGIRDKVAFVSVGGALLTRACRQGLIVATDITVKSQHAAAKGRRILLYRRAGA